MPSLWSRVRWIVFIGWIVAAIRFGFDLYAAGRPQVAAEHFHEDKFLMPFWLGGVYYVMPIVYLVAGIRRTFAGVSFGRFALACLLIALLVWGLPNLITYGTAQFQGWTFGRFTPEKRGPKLGTTTIEKLGAAGTLALLTSFAGFVWTFVLGTLLAWLPSRRKPAAAPRA